MTLMKEWRNLVLYSNVAEEDKRILRAIDAIVRAAVALVNASGKGDTNAYLRAEMRMIDAVGKAMEREGR